MWLLIWQRLQGGAPLEAAVVDLLDNLPASFWPRPCKRIQDWRGHGQPLSGNSGAYNQARQALPVAVVEQSCDHIFEQLNARLAGSGVGPGAAQAFLLDGTSMRLAHSPAVIEQFPLGSNQYGPEHWPVARVLVAHDVRTGLALRPQWGPMNGPAAVSEQQLLETAIGQLPSGARLIADRNFGVFSVAWAGAQTGHPVLLRLTHLRARRLAGGPVEDGIDRPLVWKPSREDRRRHPGLPADAGLEGRLIVTQVQPGNGDPAFLLALFTTLPSPLPELVDLYGQRWNIETDLRTLKKQLRLDQLTSATPEMAAKEIEMSIAAYNLVRAVISLAAEQTGLPPRGYSFSKVRTILGIFAPKIHAARDQPTIQRLFDRMMYYVKQAKLPNRRRRRPNYPRTVWHRRHKFPHPRR
jgi:hypothetical protein